MAAEIVARFIIVSPTAVVLGVEDRLARRDELGVRLALVGLVILLVDVEVEVVDQERDEVGALRPLGDTTVRGRITIYQLSLLPIPGE